MIPKCTHSGVMQSLSDFRDIHSKKKERKKITNKKIHIGILEKYLN